VSCASRRSQRSLPNIGSPENLPTLHDFDRQPFVHAFPHESRYSYDLVAAIFAKAGVAPRYVQHMSQVHAILALVRAGLGAALVPGAAASLRFESVAFGPIETRPARPVELFLAWERSKRQAILAPSISPRRALRGYGKQAHPRAPR
jgi:DNA-binding transcriptional LysR family regulator